MTINRGWIVAGVLIGGTVAVYLFAKQKKKAAVRSVIPPPAGSAASGTGAGTAGGQPPGSAGTNVYSKSGLTIRSSPQIDDGWFGSGFLGNIVTTIAAPNVFVGNIVSSTVDSKDARDPAGNIYTWYLINPAPTYGSAGGGAYYVREDYITIK